MARTGTRKCLTERKPGGLGPVTHQEEKKGISSSGRLINCLSKRKPHRYTKNGGENFLDPLGAGSAI